MLDIQLSGIKKIEAIVQNNNEYISLSQGALKIGGIPKKIKNHLQEILNTDKTDYYQSAWGIMPLREKLSSILSKKHSTKIDTNQIIITHGCIGALSNIFLSILEKDDEVIMPEPTYPAYEKLTKLARGKSIFASCQKNINENNNFWNLDVEKIKEKITSKTKIIIFSNPWNPLGIIISKKTILQLINLCEKNGIYLIIDEAYKDYSFTKFESSAQFINQSDFLIKVTSFSKNMAMSGWRVGYMVIPPKLHPLIGTVQDAFLNCPNTLAQHAALYALDHPEFTESFYNIIKGNLEFTVQELKPLIDKKIFSYQKPNGGFYIFLKTQFTDSEALCLGILNNAKVSLIPGKFFGESGSSFIRLCYARDPKTLNEGIQRLLNHFI